MMNRLLNTTRFIFVLSLILLASEGHAALSPHFDAKIYDIKDRSKQMFVYKSEYEVNGATKTYFNTISNMQGEVLVLEKTVMALNGSAEALVSFEQEQKQIGTKGNLEIRDGKAFFTFVKEGKTSTDDEKFTEDFIVTSTLVKFLQPRWSNLMKGETLKVRLAVLDRQETVGFQFKKDSDKEVGGAPGVILKMKPSSVIISALVDPLFFGFSADGGKLLELEGRTSVKVMVDGKFKDFDGFTVYTHPLAAVPAVVPAAVPANASKVKSKKN